MRLEHGKSSYVDQLKAPFTNPWIPESNRVPSSALAYPVPLTSLFEPWGRHDEKACQSVKMLSADLARRSASRFAWRARRPPGRYLTFLIATEASCKSIVEDCSRLAQRIHAGEDLSADFVRRARPFVFQCVEIFGTGYPVLLKALLWRAQ